MMKKKNMLNKILILILAFCFIIPASSQRVYAAGEWTEWSTTRQSGRSGEQTKTQYSSREFQGWETSATAKNSESKLVQIYYKDIEYYIIDNYKFLTTSVQSSGTGKNLKIYYKTSNNNKPTITNWTTTDQTIYQNKWNFQPTGTSKHSGAGYGEYGSTAFSVKHIVDEYMGDHGSQITGTNKKNLGGQILEWNGQIYGSSIIGLGVQADTPWGYRTGFYNGSSYDDGMIEYNEFNIWQEPDGRKTYAGATSWWSACAVTGDDDMCYDYNGGNKTELEYHDVFSTITDVNGRQITLPGIAGNHGIYLITRKLGQGVTQIGATNEVKVKKMSLIERTYYIDRDGTQTKNVVTKTYLTPKWGPWSNYQDTAITQTSTRQVRTRTLYRYPASYSVSYNANGGTGAPAQQTKTHDVTLVLSSTKPTRTHYSFVNWTSSSDNKNYAAGANYTNNADTTMKANWNPVSYTISYTMNGGSLANGQSNPTSYNVESSAITLKNPTKTGSIFTGWTGTGLSSPSKTVTIAKGSSGNRTYTANFNSIKYNIRFNGNGSTSGSMENMKNLVYETEYSLSPSQFKKTGYWQSGWSKTPNGDLVYLNEATISKLSSTDGATVDLYACWEPKQYSIRFNANNDTGLSKRQDFLTYDQTYTLLPNEFTKEGYHFVGWSVDSPGNEVTYADKAQFTNLYSETGVRDLYAHWEANDYTATISGDRGVASTSGGGSHKADSTFSINGTLKPGFSFKDWTGETNETSQEVTVKMPLHDAAWTMNTEPIVYNINYEMNDGYNNEDNPSEFTVVSDPITILDPHKAHYDFAGWTGAPGETPVIGPVIQTGTVGDQTFVANWTPTVYPVTYDLGDPEAQNHPANPAAYTIEDDTITLQDPTWPGYDFFGWKEGNTISAGSSGAKHFTAQWDPSADALVYNANGGKGTMSPDSGTQGDYVSVRENEFTRKGYTFLGWNTKSDGTGKSYKANDYYLLSYQDPNTDILYAQWELEIYPITYVLNGATNHPENPVEYDADHSYLIQPATKKGHNFLGWEEGDMIIKGSTGPKTFTANLDPYKYTVIFNGNEADAGEMPNQEFVYDTKSTLNENQFSKVGYNFLGWATEADSEEVAYQDGEEILNLSEEDGDEIELFAVWKKIVKPYTYKPCDGPVQFEPETYMVPYGDEVPPYSGGDISNDDYTFEGWTDVEDEDGNISRCPVFREIPKHTITFKYNFPGSPEDVVKVYNEGTPITIIGVPERAGYNFLYWKGSEYQPGDTYTVVEDHTFTAQWEIINYDIKYDLPSDATNNSKNPYSYNIETGVQVQDPIRPGYKFLGWQEGDTIPVGSTGEKTFTAQWELLTYNISYITGPCENHPDNPTTYNVTDSITLKVPACEGYTVDGWDPSNEIPEGSSGDKTFTLIYAPVDYKISYSLNGGENHADNPKSYTIASPTITLKDPSRHGYDFVKWSPEGRIPAGSTGDKAFSAGWIAKYYDVTYILPEGAENNPANPEKYTIEEEYNILPPIYSGHKFLGWKEGNKIPAGSTGDKTFTAEFDVIGYNIAFDCQPGSGEMATIKAQLHTSVKLPKSTCAYKGHVLTGWKYDGKVYKDESEVKDLIDRDGATVTLKAIYEIEHFNITYDIGVGGVNDPSNPNSYTVNDEVILKPATRKGYEFISWSPSGKIEKGTTGAIKFTANWKAISYAIEYNLDGGTNNPQNPSSYTIESGDIILKDPTKAGCTFKGWSPSNKISSSTLAKVTVTAQWDCSVPSSAPAAVNTGYGDNLMIQSLIATISSISAAMIAILRKKKEEE